MTSSRTRYLVFICLFLALRLQAQDAWLVAFDSADARYNRGEYQAAYLDANRSLEAYRAAGKPADSNYASILRILGLSSYSLDKFQEAVEAATREIQIRSASTDEYLALARQLRAQAFRALSKHTDAANDLEAAVTILENIPGREEILQDARMELAAAWYLAGEPQKALMLFQRHLPSVTIIDEAVIQGYYYYGLLLLEAGRAAECVEPMERIRATVRNSDLASTEDFVLFLSVFGDIYSALGKWAEAILIYRQALSNFLVSGSTDKTLTNGIYAALSAALTRSGNFPEARTALKQLESSNGSRHALASGYARMAAARLEQRQTDSAIYFLQFALKMVDPAAMEQQPLLADITRTLAQAESDRKQEAASAAWLDKSLMAARQSNRPGLLLMTLNRISFQKIRTGQIPAAEPAIREALRIVRSKPYPIGEQAQALVALGWLYNFYAQIVRSDSAFTAAVMLVSGDKTISPQLVANIRGQYAGCLQQRGDAPAALRQLTAARLAAARIKPLDPVVYAVMTSSMADLNIRIGRIAPAQMLLDSATTQLKPLAERFPSEFAGLLLSQARLQQASGAYTRAEQTGSQLLALLQSGKVNDTQLLALALDQQAGVYKAMGNFAAAEPLLNSAIHELEKSGMTSSAAHTTILQNLATLYQLQEKFDQAERLLNQVAEQDRKTLGSQHPQYAVTLQNQAALCQRLGKRDQAIRLYEESRGIVSKTLGTENRTYSTLLGNLAALYQDMERYQEAENLWKQSLELRLKLFGKEHPDYYRSLYGLANYYFATADMAKAGPYFEEVVSGYLMQVRTFFNAMSDREKGAFYARVRPVIETYMDYAVELHAKTADPLILERLYDLQLSTKAILLTSSNRVRESILSNGNEETKALYRAWQQKKEDVVHYYSAGKAERDRNGVDLVRLEAEANDLEKRLSILSAEFGLQVNGRSASWRDVQKALQPGEAAVEYIRIQKKRQRDSVYYAALVIRPDSRSPEVSILPRGLSLENKWFRYHRNAVVHAFLDSLTIRLVWTPLSGRLREAKKVYVSSDGVLNKINLSSLYDSRSRNYVLDQIDIRLVSNTSELISRPAVITDRKASVFGYPDFNLNDHREVLSSGLRNTGSLLPGVNITDLPATLTELNMVGGLLTAGQWKVALFDGREASEENLKKVRSPGILHVATHGFFKSDVAAKELESETGRDEILQNPLFRSGLLLAGAGVPSSARSEDGVLTAYEAMNLNLQNTDLVCLSACETGLGDVQNGEGVYGLQRSFLVAGARSLLMSLWQVDDEATQELMTAFYQGWTAGMNKGEAFRKAQQKIKEKYNLPFYWGAFVLVGN